LAAAAFSLAVGKADCDLANTGRQAAQDLCAKYQLPRKTLWFEGHWGFQYYMERQGAQPLQRIFGLPNPGDMLVLPAQAVNFFDVSRDLVRLVDRLEYVPNPYCSTMSRSAGAGFYAAYAGPFPYSVGHIPSERYYVFQVTQTLATAIRAPGGLSDVGALEQQLEHERTNRAVRQTPKAQTDRIFDWPTRKRFEIELAGGLTSFTNPTP
jgi:hypothetical protein